MIAVCFWLWLPDRLPPQRYINKNRVRHRYLDSKKREVEEKFFLIFVTFFLPSGGLFSINHKGCGKLPRFGNQMVGQMRQTAVDNWPHCLDIYCTLYFICVSLWVPHDMRLIYLILFTFSKINRFLRELQIGGRQARHILDLFLRE